MFYFLAQSVDQDDPATVLSIASGRGARNDFLAERTVVGVAGPAEVSRAVGRNTSKSFDTLREWSP
jgi:hypothetical protein